MKKFGRSIILLGLLALLLPCGNGQTAEGTTMLANLHKARQIGCAECHGTAKKFTVDDSESGVNQRCVRCHGTLDAMAAKV